MRVWSSFVWATTIMIHLSKSIASHVVRLPLMGLRRRKRDMQHRRRLIAGTGVAPSAALCPCNGSSGRTQPLAAAVAQAEASWLLRDLQHALNTRDEVAMSRVGNMLMAGYGTKQDPEEAALWMREAWALQNFYEFELDSPDAHGALRSKPSAAAPSCAAKRDTCYMGGLQLQHQQERGQLQCARASSSSQGANPQGTSQCASTERGCHHLPNHVQAAFHQASTHSISSSSSHQLKDSQAASHQAFTHSISSSSSHPQKDSEAAGHQASTHGISSSSSHAPKDSQATIHQTSTHGIPSSSSHAPKDSQPAFYQASTHGISSNSSHAPKDSRAAIHQASTHGISSSSSHAPKESQVAGQSVSIGGGSCHPPQTGCSSRGSTSRGVSPPASHPPAHSPSPAVRQSEMCEQQGTSSVTYGGVLGEALGEGEWSGEWGLQRNSEPSTDDFSTDEECAEDSALSLQGSLVSLAGGVSAGQIFGAGAVLRCAFKVAQGGSGSGKEDEKLSLCESESSKQCEGGRVVGKGGCETEEAGVGITSGCSGDLQIVSRKYAAEWPRACLFRTPMSGKRRRMSL